MTNIIVGGKIGWKITYKLRIMSYGCLSRMDHSSPQKLLKMKNESLELNKKVESLLAENKNLLENLKQVESELAANRR